MADKITFLKLQPGEWNTEQRVAGYALIKIRKLGAIHAIYGVKDNGVKELLDERGKLRDAKAAVRVIAEKGPEAVAPWANDV